MIKQPLPIEITLLRRALKLTQAQASEIVGLAHYMAWSRYERGTIRIPIWTWELFLLKVGEHPTHALVRKSAPPERSR